MIDSIVTAAFAEHAREMAEVTAVGEVIYFTGRPLLCLGEPAEQTRQRFAALDCFPWAPPAGNA